MVPCLHHSQGEGVPVAAHSHCFWKRNCSFINHCSNISFQHSPSGLGYPYVLCSHYSCQPNICFTTTSPLLQRPHRSSPLQSLRPKELGHRTIRLLCWD